MSSPWEAETHGKPYHLSGIGSHSEMGCSAYALIGTCICITLSFIRLLWAALGTEMVLRHLETKKDTGWPTIKASVFKTDLWKIRNRTHNLQTSPTDIGCCFIFHFNRNASYKMEFKAPCVSHSGWRMLSIIWIDLRVALMDIIRHTLALIYLPGLPPTVEFLLMILKMTGASCWQ